jgi:hypothetical protein
LRGITVHQGDCLIAAAAVGIEADLATANVTPDVGPPSRP